MFLFVQGWLHECLVVAVGMIVWKCTCGKGYVSVRHLSSASFKHHSYRWGISHIIGPTSPR